MDNNCSNPSSKCIYNKFCKKHFTKRIIDNSSKQPCFSNYKEILKNPRKGAILEGFVSCFYILLVRNDAYKKLFCFLDEQSVKAAYNIIKQVYPDEQIVICDEMIENKHFTFWEYARAHIKSIRKVSQFLNCS